MRFIDRLWSEYPIPKEASIWVGDGVTTKPLANLEDLIETCVDELKSDVLMTEYLNVSSMHTIMPKECVLVSSAKLTYAFQGNRIVKTTYDSGTRVLSIRYFPATVTWKRCLTLEDLDNGRLIGDELIYVKSYMLWKMSATEINMLKVVNLNADNASIDLDSVQKFSDEKQDIYKELKDTILIYSTVN